MIGEWAGKVQFEIMQLELRNLEEDDLDWL